MFIKKDKIPHAKKISSFLLESVAVGVTAALLLWIFLPGLQDKTKPVKENQLDRPLKSAQGQGQHASFRDAVAIAAPAVVNIYTAKNGLMGASPSSLGSGVIIDSKGYILTNFHVVKDADKIAIALSDGRNAEAELVGRDSESDLAVIKINLGNVPSIRWGDPKDIHVGDVVLAIGNPFGVGQTVTMGIVSGTGRDKLGINTFENFIQTDAAINPGNSGGALINTSGELVGINTAIFSQSGGSEGIGFAIPVELAKAMFNQIVQHGRVLRGWVGVAIQNLTEELADSFGLSVKTGVVITGIVVGGPAHQANLQVGDVITDINGQVVENGRAALNRIAEQQPGSSVDLTIIRPGQKAKKYQIKVSERPPQD